MKSKSILATILLAGTILTAACGNSDDTKKEETTPKTAVENKKSDKALDKEVAAYKAFAIDQLDKFTVSTEDFVKAVKAGDIEKAKDIYPTARMYFERSEPIAESFGDLDPRIDARLADIKDAGQGAEDWSGYHKIEYGLWVDQTTKGYEKIADQLLADTKELRARVETVEVTPKLMVNGAVDLLNEVSTSKISGEEEIYSHTDLYDFKANIEGAEKIFTILQPSIKKTDAALATKLTDKFKNVNDLLAKYETKDGGYVSYKKLTKDDTNALSNAVDQLGEPLAQMGIILE
ncbi:iron uptake system protein EfeO [Kurthia sibirica]|uniref:EfeM/EfeO family lipoprotein n=1 Tax=Kurthia sibirica TaxID=202750 RepID=A0A2U3AKA1_9BACL|nr:iron uptake system protein EfeO [Kurthia sibirica]PWI24957.1 EfeM/EfeO family lipoprotein [Kurthia sibirica]GEK33132.1 iron ABC transporter substrate-binding protein [Kurthia sibirica]